MSQIPSAAQSIEKQAEYLLNALVELGRNKQKRNEQNDSNIRGAKLKDYYTRVKNGGSSVIIETTRTELRGHSQNAEKRLCRGGRKKNKFGQKYDGHVQDEQYFASIDKSVEQFMDVVKFMEAGGDTKQSVDRMVEIIREMTKDSSDSRQGLARALVQIGVKPEDAEEWSSRFNNFGVVCQNENIPPEEKTKILETTITTILDKFNTFNAEGIHKKPVGKLKAEAPTNAGMFSSMSDVIDIMRGIKVGKEETPVSTT